MANARFQLYGLREMIANMQQLARNSPKALERAARKHGNIELTEMKRQTPVDIGTLRDSGQLDVQWVRGSTLTIEWGFGGAAEDYAIYVHEDLDAWHRVGNAKFVERPLKEAEPYLMARIATDWANNLGL